MPQNGAKSSLLLSATRRTGKQFVPTVEAALAKATAAAAKATAMTALVKKQAKANLKFGPLVKAEVGTAEAAATAAKESDEAVTKLMNETRAKVEAAALSAAQMYYKEVQAAGQAAAAASKVGGPAAEMHVENTVATASAKAAAPFSAALLRAQKQIGDNIRRSQAMAAASNELFQQSWMLANSARTYLAQRTPTSAVQAKQIMLTAHSVFHQAQLMKQEAEMRHANAEEVYALLPSYQIAQHAAVENAAFGAAPDFPAPPPPY